MLRRACLCLLLVSLATGATHPPEASAQVLLTQEEALRLAFPGADTERRTAFLSEPQLDSVRQLAGSDVEVGQRVLTYYVAVTDGRHVGTAYFDAHRVRTLDEVIMVVVDPESRVERVEVLRFAEPVEYLAPEAWIEQMEGKGLSEDLSLKGDIIGMTGATLTSRAMVRAVRRVLAFHQVICPEAARAAAPDVEDGDR